MVCCTAACCISATTKLTLNRWISSIFCKYRRFRDLEEACSTHVPGVQTEPLLHWPLRSRLALSLFLRTSNGYWDGGFLARLVGMMEASWMCSRHKLKKVPVIASADNLLWSFDGRSSSH